jgi:hypothetical protein
LSSAVPPNCLLTRISARDSKFAAIVVGPKKARFTVHEELLTYHSPYFRAALTGGFKEAEDKAVTLSEERVPIVEFFVHWLYYQCLPNADDPIDLYDAWNDGEADGELMTSNLIELYVFGDKFDVPGLKSQAMTDLFKHIEDVEGTELPSADAIRFAFGNLPEHAPLLQFLADTYCHWARSSMWEHFGRDDWPPAFLGRVLGQYTEFAHGDRDRFIYKDPCDYHAHRDGEERLACEIAQGLGHDY